MFTILIGILIYFFQTQSTPSNGSHKHCEKGICICDDGWSGNECQTQSLIPPTPPNQPPTPPTPPNQPPTPPNQPPTPPCDDGWSGKDCKTQIPCKVCKVCRLHEHREKCKCVCDDGWSGDDCQTPPLECTTACILHEHCDNGKCVCDDGWSGDDCKTKTYISCPRGCPSFGRPSDPNSHGYCDNNKCVCFQGYSGIDCTIPPDKCSYSSSDNPWTSMYTDKYTDLSLFKDDLEAVCVRYDDAVKNLGPLSAYPPKNFYDSCSQCKSFDGGPCQDVKDVDKVFYPELCSKMGTPYMCEPEKIGCYDLFFKDTISSDYWNNIIKGKKKDDICKYFCSEFGVYGDDPYGRCPELCKQSCLKAYDKF